MATGAPVENINIAGRNFPVAQDSEVLLDLGGARVTEIRMNGDGSASPIYEITPGKIGPAMLDIDPDRDDQKFLSDVTNRKFFVDGSVTLGTGEVYSGKIQIIEAQEYNTKNGTMEVTISGSKLRKQ